MNSGWTKRDGLIAMHQIQGVGWHTLDKMIQMGWRGDRPVEGEVEGKLREFGVPSKTVERILKRWKRPFIQNVKQELYQRNIQALTQEDDDYPEWLKTLPQPPWVLYVRGDPGLLSRPAIAVVGTRKPTAYGRKAARTLTAQLARQGWVIVSGMAEGIDGEAHRCALEAGGKTVAVLGSGVDVVYPKHHRGLYEAMIKQGAVCSESPPGVRPHPGLFPRRNRVISGLSMGVLVVEAAERSGSLITADIGMEQGREVFAVPGPITSDQSYGTNRLIQQGAKCVLQVEDIEEEFSWLKDRLQEQIDEKQVSVSLTKIEEEVLQFISEEPVSIEELAAKCRSVVPELHTALLSLQMKKCIQQLPGARYIRDSP
ncbi:DNA-protecting protein DprA [Kroppenstedtia pulmonis]|uniref:DNA-protecting protein DprA n=1 Tax=Kroppenstedtia pulmonis TaxID=1380685 RepID=A0A7D3Y0L6_9BACL|nr:DNA-processing protein DprA [Kroppenstedtia pulmonis]QKG84580.1 DNA-protecting protein DprA [Kroppenstedtia pulmonis]